jgi:hypothetical protein
MFRDHSASPTQLSDIAAAMGTLAPDVQRIIQFGRARDIDTLDTPCTVWPGLSLSPKITMFPRPMVAEQWEVVATNPADHGITVRWDTLDVNYVQFSDVTTLGAAPVLLPGLRYRVNAAIITAGGRAPVGNIFLRVAGGGAIREIIEAGEGRATTPVFCVPEGYTLAVYSIRLQVHNILRGNNLRGVRVRPVIKLADGTPIPAAPFTVSSEDPPFVRSQMPIPLVALNQRTEFSLECEVTGGGNNIDLSADFAAYLVANHRIRRPPG